MIYANPLQRSLSVVVAGLLTVLVSACGSVTNASTSTHSSARSVPHTKAAAGVVIGNNNAGDPDWVKTLDPCCVTDSISISDIDMVNANLVKTDYPGVNIVPDLATWTVSSNHKVYTFRLNPRARFSNGDPVTAQDAAWSITRSLLPATKSPVASTYLSHIQGAAAVAAGKAKQVRGLKVLNAHTLQISLDAPIAYFLGALSYPTADVLDRRVMQGKAPQAYLTNTCSGNVGAGPFKFVCRSKGSGKASFYPSGHSPYMDMVANPYYFGAKPRVRYHLPFFSDVEANWRAYQGGEVDATSVPTADISKARSMPGFHQYSLLSTDYITPNAQIAPFKNLHCRLAVAYAIDREGITSKLLHGTEVAMYDVLPKGLLGYFNSKNGVPHYDPTRAKKELAQCPGHLNNAILSYQATGQDIAHEYDAVKANLQAIGANITLKPLVFNSWLNVVGQSMMATKNQENITENLWIDDYADPQDWLDNLLTTGANYNIGGFHNAQYDALVKRANVEANPSRRADLYRQAQQIVLNQGGFIGVGSQVQFTVANPRVKGLVFAPGLNVPVPNRNDWSQVSVK